MARIVAFIFLIVAVATISAAPNCGENEEFKSCGSSCSPTCQNPSPSVCTLACVQKCDCVEGYLRNAAGRCVLTQNC